MKADNTKEQFGASHGRTYVIVWIALLVLTAITVTIAELHLGRFSTMTALVIATAKASLVLAFFMHLRDEKRVFKVMFFVPVLTLGVILVLTFIDIWYR
jgi:cytochrome c oxidase subunit 4